MWKIWDLFLLNFFLRYCLTTISYHFVWNVLFHIAFGKLLHVLLQNSFDQSNTPLFCCKPVLWLRQEWFLAYCRRWSSCNVHWQLERFSAVLYSKAHRPHHHFVLFGQSLMLAMAHQLYVVPNNAEAFGVLCGLWCGFQMKLNEIDILDAAEWN